MVGVTAALSAGQSSHWPAPFQGCSSTDFITSELPGAQRDCHPSVLAPQTLTQGFASLQVIDFGDETHIKKRVGKETANKKHVMKSNSHCGEWGIILPGNSGTQRGTHQLKELGAGLFPDQLPLPLGLLQGGMNPLIWPTGGKADFRESPGAETSWLEAGVRCTQVRGYGWDTAVV